MDDESTIKYYNNLINKDFHDLLFKELSDKVPWTHGVYKIFGKPIKTPRLLYAMTDDNLGIKNVYKVTDFMPWTNNILKLKKN